MTFDEFKELFDDDRHSLSDLIKEGEIPFEICLEANGRMGLPPLLLVSMLVHPKCEITFFKVNYYPITMKAGTIARNAIIPYASTLRDLECVKEVIAADEPTIESIIKSYKTGFSEDNFKMLIKNPHIPVELKETLYELTGDDRLLSQAARDIFLF